MMTRRGHTVIHYGHEDSNVECTEHVTVVTRDDWKQTYGDYDWRSTFFRFNQNEDYTYKVFEQNSIPEIRKRAQKNDFVLAFFGNAHQRICESVEDLGTITVEPGIGYGDGTFAKFRIYESYSTMHVNGGFDSLNGRSIDWYSTVLPLYFDTEEFEYREEKEDYFLFLGRICAAKGVDIAIQTTAEIGAKLKIAGQGNLRDLGYRAIPDHVEMVGYADVEKRKNLMSRARGGFVASQYYEPFGAVVIEYFLSGTPVMTTDWGAFTETNLHGITGYRCRTFGDFCSAARNIDQIDPKKCREWGLNYDMMKLGRSYEKVFQDFYNVNTPEGWYSKFSDLKALQKEYPI
jgi:glycosyltransferase involved in cell wall biosynthesis